MAPGLALSIQMSARSSRCSSCSRPSDVVWSITTPRLPALCVANRRLTPACSGGSARDGAPPGGSTRITSAPRSARKRPHISPLPSAMSITRTPSSGVGRSCIADLAQHDLRGLPQPLPRSGDQDCGDRRVAPGVEVVADLVSGSDQGELLHQLRRHGGRRFVLLSVEVKILEILWLCP